MALSDNSDSIMRFWNPEKTILLSAFFAAVLWINPLSDFPLNDDWSYALNVKNWLETGFLKFDDWAAMTQLTHIASGALVSYVFGFSHITLRLLTLGVVFVWLLFRQHYQKPLVTALVLSNPLFFSLSFTFMTDVLFSVLFWLSFDLLVQRKTKAAGATAVLATLDRQPGAGLGFAWLAESVLRRIQLSKRALPHMSKPSLIGPILLSILLSILLVAVLAGYKAFFSASGGLSANYNSTKELLWVLSDDHPFQHLGGNFALALVYAGFFTAPLMPLFFRRMAGREQKWMLMALSAGLFGLTFFRFPSPRNPGLLLNAWGIGPAVLPGGHAFDTVFPGFLLLCCALGSSTAAYLLAQSYRILKDPESGFAHRMAVVTTFGYLAFLMTGKVFFDRYVLLVLPFTATIALFNVEESTKGRKAAYALLAVTFLGSVALTHHWMDWNRARWELTEQLQREGIPAQQINGGFEFNGWVQNGVNPTGIKNKWNPPGWYKGQDTSKVCYAVGMQPLPGFSKRTQGRHGFWIFQKED